MENQQKLILIKDLGHFIKEGTQQKRKYGLYKCHCGIEFISRTDGVKSGKTKSCGCQRKTSMMTHSLSKHRLYQTWISMIKRCEKEISQGYVNYGKRGIKVCDRWHDIENFIEDMYPSYKDGLSIDRINNDGDYEPNNCRWANKTIQSRNKRILQKNNTSGYRGVYLFNNKWKVAITLNGKKVHLGQFDSIVEGALAYDKYIRDNNLEHTTNF